MIASLLGRLSGGVAALVRTLAPALAKLAPLALMLVVGAAAYHFAPVIGVRQQLASSAADLRKAEADRDAWFRRSAGWEQSFRLSESRRAAETRTAVAAASSQAAQCSTRVAEARASARVIERIVTKEPTYDANRCPVRERVDPDLLREALAGRAGPDR